MKYRTVCMHPRESRRNAGRGVVVQKLRQFTNTIPVTQYRTPARVRNTYVYQTEQGSCISVCAFAPHFLLGDVPFEEHDGSHHTFFINIAFMQVFVGGHLHFTYDSKYGVDYTYVSSQ